MSRHDPTAIADAEISRLELANRTAFYLVMELEHHPVVTLLSTGHPTGRSGQWWASARRDLGLLWELFVRHSAGLAAIRMIRDRRDRLSVADLEVIAAISDGTAPGAPRALPDLISDMIARGEEVRTVLDGIEQVEGALAPRLDQCAAHLTAGAERARRLGTASRRQVDGLTARLHELRRAVRCDPLAQWTGTEVEFGPVNALGADCAEVLAELTALDELRAQAPAALADLDRTLVRLEEFEWRATLGRAEAAVALGQRAEPSHRRRSAELRAALTRARALAAAGDWAAVHRSVAELRAALPEALQVAADADGSGRQPAQDRSELQALLGLYQLKAARLGRTAPRFHPVALERAYRRAGELLRDTAADLDAARAAVECYRNLVNGAVPAAENRLPA